MPKAPGSRQAMWAFSRWAELSWHEMRLRSAKRSLIAQKPTPHLCNRHRSAFPHRSLPPPPPWSCPQRPGAILRPRFPGVKSQHLNSECQCSILLSATRLDCRPARESGLVAHWVTSHLFSSILCCHKFIPARCG